MAVLRKELGLSKKGSNPAPAASGGLQNIVGAVTGSVDPDELQGWEKWAWDIGTKIYEQDPERVEDFVSGMAEKFIGGGGQLAGSQQNQAFIR